MVDAGEAVRGPRPAGSAICDSRRPAGRRHLRRSRRPGVCDHPDPDRSERRWHADRRREPAHVHRPHQRNVVHVPGPGAERRGLGRLERRIQRRHPGRPPARSELDRRVQLRRRAGRPSVAGRQPERSALLRYELSINDGGGRRTSASSTTYDHDGPRQRRPRTRSRYGPATTSAVAHGRPTPRSPRGASRASPARRTHRPATASISGSWGAPAANGRPISGYNVETTRAVATRTSAARRPRGTSPTATTTAFASVPATRSDAGPWSAWSQTVTAAESAAPHPGHRQLLRQRAGPGRTVAVRDASMCESRRRGCSRTRPTR